MKQRESLNMSARLDVSVIIPCYNEKENIEPLFYALIHALKGWKWEAIFVDDNSPDGTIHVIRELAAQDDRIKELLRVNRRGLSSAVIDGVLLSSATCIAVIDGDMQHDETRLPQMLNAVLHENYDFAIGSRHIEGGRNTGLANDWRHFLSNSGIWISQKFLPVSLKDPMSGFFVMRRDLFLKLQPSLSGAGFKILVDLIISCPSTIRIKEIPFHFRKRVAGYSKLDSKVMFQFVLMLIEKFIKKLA